MPHLGTYGGHNPEVSDREACASLYVAVNILTHHDGIRHSGLEGRSSTTARGLCVLIACTLQQFLQNPPPDHTVDTEALSNFVDSFSFSEVRKRTLQSRFCSVLCDTTSDQDTLLNCGCHMSHVPICVICPVDGRHLAYLPLKGGLYCAPQPHGTLLEETPRAKPP